MTLRDKNSWGPRSAAYALQISANARRLPGMPSQVTRPYVRAEQRRRSCSHGDRMNIRPNG